MILLYRKKLGKKQEDFANILGISIQSYNAKENGKRYFNDKEKVLLKNYINNNLGLSLTIDELFF